MAQDNQSTQPHVEAQNDTSSQPSVEVRDLDDGGQDGVSKTPEDMITPKQESAAVEEAPQQDLSDDLRKLLEEQKQTIEDLKKGLYDKGREMKQMKEALTSVAPESTQQMEESAASDDEVEAAVQALRSKGVVTEDVLESFAKKMEEKQEVINLLQANPQMDPEALEAFRAINPDLHVLDVIEKHKNVLLGDQALQKAHNRSVIGQPISKEPKEKTPITAMSDDEFNIMLKQNSKGSHYI